MTTHQAEIIVCGGSLAGLSAAIQLKKLGYNPLVLEKAKFPRAKLCGEFLGPDAFPVLKELGLLNRVEQAAYGRIDNVIFHNRSGNKMNIPLRWMSRKYPYAVAIPREKLDFIMLEYARSLSIQVLEQTRVQPSVSKVGNWFNLNVQTPETVMVYQTRIFVDASGRNSGVCLDSNEARMIKTGSKTLGLQCHVHCEVIQDLDLRMYLFPGGYGGIQPISPGLANLCVLLNEVPINLRKTDFHSVIRNTVQLNPATQPFINALEPATGFNTTANLNLYGIRNEILQIGDARLTVEPFTGSGMAQALETGYLAANIIHQGMQNQWPYEQIRNCYQHFYTRKYAFRLQALRLFRPILFSGIAQTIAWPFIRMASPQLTTLFR